MKNDPGFCFSGTEKIKPESLVRGFTAFRISYVSIPRNCKSSFSKSHSDFYYFLLEVLEVFLMPLLLVHTFTLSLNLRKYASVIVPNA